MSLNTNAYASSQIIIQEVNKFVTGIDGGSKLSPEDSTACALYLLRAVPSARHAVLEHLTLAVDEAVNRHFMHIELGSSDSSSEVEEGLLEDISETLQGFIKASPQQWAPIISTWAIELLGSISGKYASKRSIAHASSLNEQLQFWMSCAATKILMEIATQCFASMVGSSPDVSINKLLEASVKHSPHFDWVVAHIGSCFPNTIITRVLLCGLKEFYYHGNKQGDVAMTTDENLPKIGSVVGILGHLAHQHGPNIRRALLSLFKESLSNNSEPLYQVTMSYLMNLAVMSNMLLHVMATEFINILTVDVLNQLCDQYPQWQGKTPTDTYLYGLLNMLVHLLVKCEEGTVGIITFLFDTAASDTNQTDAMEPLNPKIQKACEKISSKLLVELQRQVLSKHDGTHEIPLLSSLKQHCHLLCDKLLQSNPTSCEWYVSLLGNIGCYCGQTCASDTLAYMFFTAKTHQQLGMVVALQKELETRLPGVVHDLIPVISLCLRDQAKMAGTGYHDNQDNLVTNLLAVVQWETEKPLQVTRCQLSSCVTQHMAVFADILASSRLDTSLRCVRLLSYIPLLPSIDVATITRPGATVQLLFNILTYKEGGEKVENTCTVWNYCVKLCSSSTSCRLLQRYLLDRIIKQQSDAELFGSTVDVNYDVTPLTGAMSSLHDELHLHQHIKTQAYGGVIGQGRRAPREKSDGKKESHLVNRQLLIHIIWATCKTYDESGDNQPVEGNSSEVNQALQDIHKKREVNGEAVLYLSQLVVEYVTPDALYNQTAWPEEDFMKVTLERDLYIKKQFDNKPILWDIMEVIANDHLALAKSSPVLRGLLATQVNYWHKCRDKAAGSSPYWLNQSQNLIEYMKKGHLLPQPLCYINEFFHLVAPYEVFLLLTNVWAFIRENPQNLESETPTLQPGCATNFMALIQSILHSNIDKLGHYYPRFFQKT